jgi:putative transcriptional regulator
VSNDVQPRAGLLLVATPGMADPNFAHAVVLLLEHDDGGSVGVVLNRPSAVTVPSLLPAMDLFAAQPPVVFEGGPVQRDGVLGLAACDGASTLVRQLVPGLGVLDLDADPELLLEEVAQVRLFAGYAGWSPGQLDAELEAGGWFLVEALHDDVFTAEPEQLWSAVLRRQGGVFVTIPEDPSQN